MQNSPIATLDDVQLRRAFDENRFELFYQPQVDSRDNRLLGVEALVRLRDETGSLVPPSAFIEQVERSNLVHDLGLTLFEEGCRQASQWPSLTMAINVSPVQFRDVELASKLSAIADRSKVDPKRIEIEITEGLFFDDAERAAITLQALHECGFSLALDDFGTGYSCLGYLLRLPVSKIKIDKSFVSALPQDVKSASIVHALVALTRALGLKTVAEGVETDAQRLFLRTAGCHVLQGYLFGAPMTQDEIAALAAEQRRVA